MTTRGFLLYQLTAKARGQHSDGHSGIDCTVPDEIDMYLGESHTSHPFYEWHAEYSALVAQGVSELPICPVCFNSAGVTLWIPGRVLGGAWLPGVHIRECGYCGHRISYEPGK